MGVHANAKLGPAGRRELVRLIREGRPRGRPRPPSRSRRRPLTGGRCASARPAASSARRELWALDRSSRPHRSPRRTDAEIERRVCRGARAHGLGSAVDRRRDRGRALDRPRDPRPPRPARARPGGPHGGVLSLRVAVPGRSAAHGRQALPALCCGPATRSPATAPARTPRRSPSSATTTSTPSSTTTAAWPTASCSTTSAPRTVTAFVKRALAWFAEHGITTRRLMTDGAWSYTRNRVLRRTADRTPHPPHRHAALHAALEREGGALPPDHGTRVGQGPALPQPPRPQPSAATLARALQRAQTPQLPRRPTPDQPRSQPLRAGQLIWPEVCQVRSTEGPALRGFCWSGRRRAGAGGATRGHTDMRGLDTAGPGFRLRARRLASGVTADGGCP